MRPSTSRLLILWCSIWSNIWEVGIVEYVVRCVRIDWSSNLPSTPWTY
jgi:hypothetical protein